MPRERSTDVSPVVSAVQLSTILAVDRGTVVDVWVPRGCPVVQKGDAKSGKSWGFRVADVSRWLADGGAMGSGGPSRRDSDARRAAAEAALAELELEERRGEVIRRADSSAVIADTFATVRSRVLGAAPELSRVLPTIEDPKERDRAATKILGDALRVLVDDLAAAPAPRPADE